MKRTTTAEKITILITSQLFSTTPTKVLTIYTRGVRFYSTKHLKLSLKFRECVNYIWVVFANYRAFGQEITYIRLNPQNTIFF